MRIMLTALVLATCVNASFAHQPNVVIFLCDDLGYGDLGCYGHPHIKTPNIDKLAIDGIRFTDFYSTAPVCSPSRVGLLTGRSPNLAGVYDWIPPGKTPRKDAREQVHMRKFETTLPFLLKIQGYATCLAGKWHCNSQFNSDTQPQPDAFGFDHWFATQNNAAPSHENPVNFVRNGKPVGKIEGYSCQIVVDEAVNWLKKLKKDDPHDPYFIFVPFHEPHEPVASPPDLVKQYLKVAKTEDEAQFFANVANVDQAVGRFMSVLDEMKLREDTLVIFTSDNGPETLNRYRSANRSYGRPGPLRGMKLHTHDAGFRVAGIANWAGHIKAGQVSHVPVSALDLLPTICRLTDTRMPTRKLHGTDIRKALNGEPFERTVPLHWCYFNALNEARVAMRDGKWKMLARIRTADGESMPRMQNVTPQQRKLLMESKLSDWELYDATKDIGEKNNLVESSPDTAKELSAKLDVQYRKLLDESHVWKPVISSTIER